MINEDIVKGKIKQAEGNVQEKVGRATGNRKQEVHGRAKQVDGHIQEGIGKVKNAVKDVAKDLK